MIEIKHKRDCCGCSACVQVCPKQCIGLSADNEGFLYPQVDTSVCIECGLCEKVCPIINQAQPTTPIAVYAAKNKNEKVRFKSSSGGVFTLLAEEVITAGGVVFGARFDMEWNVVHDYTETIEGLKDFRGSKYVQSLMGDNFSMVRQFLAEGRKVLFSGTPCQVAGLRKFLRKEYDDLLTIEVVCHGVPSPMIWRDYLDYKRAKHTDKGNIVPIIKDISFRDKTNGWRRYGFKIDYEANCELTPFNRESFMRGFLKDLYLRPSCHHCAARQGKSGADISIADFWGIHKMHPEIDDNKGVNAVLINTQKGLNIYQTIIAQTESVASSYDKVIKHNPCIVASTPEPAQRQVFWNEYPALKSRCIDKICKEMTPTLIVRVAQRIAKKIKSIVRC